MSISTVTYHVLLDHWTMEKLFLEGVGADHCFVTDSMDHTLLIALCEQTPVLEIFLLCEKSK